MRITFVTLGRVPLLHLARELAALGHEVRILSAARRTSRVEAQGERCSSQSLGPLVSFWSRAWRNAPDRFKPRIDPLLQRLGDRTAARRLGACDVFVGTTGFCVRSAVTARIARGASVVLTCSGHHVLAHKQMLESLPGARRPAISHFDIKRELWGYASCDLLVTPNSAAAQSYLERGVPRERIFSNLPGADLESFTPTSRPPFDVPTILYIGRWSVRKGCDLLGRAVDGKPWRVIHVGPGGDAAPPRIMRYEQRLDVAPWAMRQIYRDADVLVHASFEDPIDQTQLRGLASGLPLVCSDWSGGEDVRPLLDQPEYLTVVPVGRLDMLREGLDRALTQARGQAGVRNIFRAGSMQVSWKAHARRFDEKLSAFGTGASTAMARG